MSEVEAKGLGGRRARRASRPWNPSVAVLKTAAVVAVVSALGFAFPIANLLLDGRTIDNTVSHGDDCLTEPQGPNLRCWDLFVPNDFGQTPVPLVIELHGFLNTVETQRGFSDIEVIAEEEGFIVAWPYGVNWSWNSGGEAWPSDTSLDKRPGIGCCGHSLNQGIDDVGFITTMIEELTSQHNIDEDRIFVTGFSNGCNLAQRVALESSTLVDAAACMSGFLLADDDSTYMPVPILEIHGSADPVAEYEPSYWPGVEANMAGWLERNGCTDDLSEVWRDGEHTMRQATACTDGATVAQLTLDGYGHIVFQGEQWLPIDTTRIAWEFMMEQTR